MSRQSGSADQWESIAGRSNGLIQQLLLDASLLGLEISTSTNGATIIDCGIASPGSWEAGRRIVEISQGGAAHAWLGTTEIAGSSLPKITVESWQPALSAYGLQVSVPLIEIDPAMRLSGPILAALEPETTRRLPEMPEDLRGDRAWGIGVLETKRIPTEETIDALAQRSGRTASEMILLAVPTHSISGATQIAGRINECVLFTLQESLGIDANRVSHILGEVPIGPGIGNGNTFPLTSDDYIHYAGRVILTIDTLPGINLAELATNLTFRSTQAYGRPFAELLDEAGGVFEAISGLIDLNKVAQITVIHQRTGETVSAGMRDEALLAKWIAAATGRKGTEAE
ncbi:methenyltetrahydromethanopterin cyclohydrolase [Candidatus Bipolaricaulota bacterium]